MTDKTSPPKVLPFQNCELSEFKRRRWSIIAKEGDTIEDIKKPEYWINIANKIAVFDILEVMSEDVKFYAEFIVVNKDKNWLLVRQLSFSQLSGEGVATKDTTDDFEVIFSPAEKFRVVRKSNKQLVSDRPFSTKEAAENWLHRNIKEITA